MQIRRKLGLNRSITIAFIAVTLNGCYPLEQAPLVYSSKSTIGVGVSAGTSDNPGLEVAIGYRETNVALVPVAVAKYCDHASDSQCENLRYALEIVRGSKVDTVENKDIQAQIENFERQQADLIQQEVDVARRLTGLNSLIDKYQLRQGKISQRDNLPAIDATGVDQYAEQRAQLQSDIASIQLPNDFDINEARKTKSQLDNSQINRKQELDTLATQLAQYRARLLPSINGQRGDAFSVFGTFKGSASGEADGASLSAGKIFATGIAAQNLSEQAGISDCLSNIAYLASLIKVTDERKQSEADTHRNALLSSGASVCTPRTDR
jgi:hypothetical protein